jgi:hypothetical protein
MSYDMTEIEKRLQMAISYRQLLDTRFLKEGDVNDLIEDELKEFVRDRLEVLLGARPAENPSVHFTAMEIVALKTLAKKVLEPKKELPVQKEVEESPPVAMAPTPKKPSAPRKQIKKNAIKKESKPVVIETQEEPVEQSDNVFSENGRTYEWIEVDGKPFAKDITKQVRASGAVPMPTASHMATISQQMAYQELAAIGGDPITQALIQASMR